MGGRVNASWWGTALRRRLRGGPSASVAACLAVAVAVLAAPPARGAVTYAETPHEVRLDVGVAAPVGLVGARYGYRVAARGPWLSAGLGLGYTGLHLSAVVDQPLVTAEGVGGNTDLTLSVYLGYAVGFVRDGLSLPASLATTPPDGNYHWLDGGLTLRGGIGHLLFSVSLGVSGLAGAPELTSLSEDRFVFGVLPLADGWVRGRLVPSLGMGLGARF